MTKKVNIKNMTLQELETFVTEDLGEKRFRARQIFQWMYQGVTAFEEMTNLSKTLREQLENQASLGLLKIERVQVSKLDGTRKYLFALEDGQAIESVFMRYQYGNSLCVSSQAGCRMGCKFCASGLLGLARDLTAGEMIEQVLAAERESGETINHIVIMGTGEPLDNYAEVSRFLQLLHDPAGKGLSWRNITVSTCGLVEGIRRFAEDFPQVNLAISLHAPNDRIRGEMMPVTKAYPMETLLAACRDYTKTTGRRITFEYTLVRDVNDGKEQAEELAKRLRGMLCHVNLIPLNAVKESGYDTTGRQTALAFQQVLQNLGIPATIRRELGDDIDGACGQLRLSREREI